VSPMKGVSTKRTIFWGCTPHRSAHELSKGHSVRQSGRRGPLGPAAEGEKLAPPSARSARQRRSQAGRYARNYFRGRTGKVAAEANRGWPAPLINLLNMLVHTGS
jgi:hypothetical protein